MPLSSIARCSLDSHQTVAGCEIAWDRHWSLVYESLQSPITVVAVQSSTFISTLQGVCPNSCPSCITQDANALQCSPVVRSFSFSFQASDPDIYPCTHSDGAMFSLSLKSVCIAKPAGSVFNLTPKPSMEATCFRLGLTFFNCGAPCSARGSRMRV